MIRIQNIYYMLAYAFQVLNEQGYKSIASEDFENTAELCTAILIQGVSSQLKRGLGKEYNSLTEELSTLRGKIDISESVKTQAFQRKKLCCSYDEFSVNSYMNRIIKSTMLLLLRADITRARKKNLRKLLVLFNEVDTVDLHNVNWNFQYNRNNQTYRMMITVCYLIVKGLLQTQSDGSTKIMDFLDEQHMHRLYFITAHLELDHLIGSDFTLLNQAVTRNDDEELPFCVVPVLSLCYSGLTDIHTELTAVSRFKLPRSSQFIFKSNATFSFGR